MNTALTVGVGKLVEFACRTGDLIFSAPTGPSALEGIRAHQKLQKQRPKGSEAEYPLKVQVPGLVEGLQFTLQGRVDILHPQQVLDIPPCLEEIKTTYCVPDRLPDSQRQLHWSQLKLYGYCYGLQQAESGSTLSKITLQMSWYDLKTKQVHRDSQQFAWDDLARFAQATLTFYARWMVRVMQQQQATVASARQLEFPFPHYRAGQREMAVLVYRSLRDRRVLMIEAPTGIGKTVSSLYPAIKALGESVVNKVVYLTAKNSGRQIVRAAVEHMREQGLELSLLILQARNKTCVCAKGACPFTRGFFDRLPAARQAMLTRQMMTPEATAEIAAEFQLCPFELSMQMLPWATLVVCDFNYVFDPLVRLSYFQDHTDTVALLVDEAHNLGDRARDMYSALLDRGACGNAARLCKGTLPSMHRAINRVIRAVDRWCQQTEQAVVVREVMNAGDEALEDHFDAISRALGKVVETAAMMADDQVNGINGAPLPEALGDWLKEVYRYLVIENLMGAQHKILTRQLFKQQLKLLCLDASAFLRQSYRHFHSVVLFSATLRPAQFFQQTLGLPEETLNWTLPSPFAPEHLGVFLCPYVDTRYQHREASVNAIIDIIVQTFQARRGNYLVFFPSYQFMQQVAQALASIYPDLPIIEQQAGADEIQRGAFLNAFDSGQPTLGFAIMGGIFGEGVDYIGERLIGAIVVGVGLPQINEEQALIKVAYDAQGAPGFDYAYRYPGMIRVLQTAGRVIRSERDQGVVVLVDSRFSQSFYQSLFPAHWQLRHCFQAPQLQQQLADFWQSSSVHRALNV